MNRNNLTALVWNAKRPIWLPGREDTMATSYKDCQSCGMPLSKDAKGGGTNADGSLSRTYCSHCYVEGRFTQPGITAAEMQAFVKGKLREMGLPGFVGWFFTRKIPKLARWSGTRAE
jgi:hypothetical protein